MAIATVIFWLGRSRYVHVPPSAHRSELVLAVSSTALRTRRRDRARALPGLALSYAGAAGGVAGAWPRPRSSAS